MSATTTSPTANYAPTPHPSRPVVEYVTDWQLIPDNLDDQALPQGPAETTATAGGSEADEETVAT